MRIKIDLGFFSRSQSRERKRIIEKQKIQIDQLNKTILDLKQQLNESTSSFMGYLAWQDTVEFPCSSGQPTFLEKQRNILDEDLRSLHIQIKKANEEKDVATLNLLKEEFEVLKSKHVLLKKDELRAKQRKEKRAVALELEEAKKNRDETKVKLLLDKFLAIKRKHLKEIEGMS